MAVLGTHYPGQNISAILSKHLEGHLDPPVSDVMFFGSKEVSWIPLSGTLRFMDQRRSVGSPCQWRYVFWIKGGQLDPPVCKVTLFGSNVGFCGFSWFPVSFSWFQVGFHGFSWFQVGFSPKCTRPNSFLARRSSLGPPPGDRHRT